MRAILMGGAPIERREVKFYAAGPLAAIGRGFSP